MTCISKKRPSSSEELPPAKRHKLSSDVWSIVASYLDQRSFQALRCTAKWQHQICKIQRHEISLIPIKSEALQSAIIPNVFSKRELVVTYDEDSLSDEAIDQTFQETDRCWEKLAGLGRKVSAIAVRHEGCNHIYCIPINVIPRFNLLGSLQLTFPVGTEKGTIHQLVTEISSLKCLTKLSLEIWDPAPLVGLQSASVRNFHLDVTSNSDFCITPKQFATTLVNLPALRTFDLLHGIYAEEMYPGRIHDKGYEAIQQFLKGLSSANQLRGLMIKRDLPISFSKLYKPLVLDAFPENLEVLVVDVHPEQQLNVSGCHKLKMLTASYHVRPHLKLPPQLQHLCLWQMDKNLEVTRRQAFLLKRPAVKGPSEESESPSR